MPIPYSSADASNDFSNARVGAGTYIEYPLLAHGDTTAKIYHLICQVNSADYSPIALDVPLSGATGVIGLPAGYSDSNAFHVGDFNLQAIDGGMISFDRRFATIPASKTKILTGTTAYTYPGMKASTENGTVRTVTGTSNNNTVFFCTNTVVAGNTVVFSLLTEDPITGARMTQSGFATALIGTNSNQVVIRGAGGFSDFVSGSITELAATARDALSLPAGTYTDYDYFFDPDPTTVLLGDVFKPSATILTAGTVPTAIEYQAKIDDAEYLLISSEITRYAGSIIQRANNKVLAQ